mgnify:CR=1 FL=1
MKEMSEIEMDRIIEMAWEDRTPFEAIEIQFEISEKEIIKLMRTKLKKSSFKLWRKRVHSRISQKHLHKRNPDISRFKCSRQKMISNNLLVHSNFFFHFHWTKEILNIYPITQILNNCNTKLE